MSIQIHFEGNLGKQSEVKTTKNGKTFTNLVVASTPRKKINGEWADGETVWFNVTFWGELPEVVYATGAKVLVSGSLETKSYEKDGQERKMLVVTADSIGIVHRQKSAPTQQQAWPPTPTSTKPLFEESDVPF
jgi:single-strand DNA-binding protein